MTLPASGTIDLNAVKTEFGATGTQLLTAFYRGGTYVPDIAPNSGVPTSGQIDLQDFYSARNVVATATTRSVNNPTNCAYTIKNTGQVWVPGTTNVEDWLNYTSDAANWEVIANFLFHSGSEYSGTFDTWLACTSDRTWAPQISPARDATVYGLTFTLQFRRAGGPASPAVTISLGAE